MRLHLMCSILIDFIFEFVHMAVALEITRNIHIHDLKIFGLFSTN
uniref:Uncharacterized protein n=1 Tax=Rhizophora mucronata TaxID=61149 RepID=A0A2P2QWP8_RHIMU